MTMVPSINNISLRWLLRLRWVALAGQVVTLVFAAVVLELELPWVPLAGVMLVTAATNVLLRRLAAGMNRLSEWMVVMVIAADMVLLTVMIYFTGGASNPFTSFYLVLVALASMSLGVRWLSGMVVLAFSCYLVVYYHGRPLKGPGGIGEIGCPGYGLHLQGMAVAFLLTSLCVAYFVQRMHRSLQARDAALAEMEAKAARADQFSALAALAAGVAHELGSPLGTIAVAGRELERGLERQGADGETLEDARLIRREVERCRRILDRLDQRSTSGTGDAPEPMEAGELVEGVEEALPEGMWGRLRVKCEGGGEVVQLPRRPVVQAVVILVQNACEADETGAEVELEVRIGGGELEVVVRDRGPGLSAAARVHAGEPFFTTKPPRHGMGLGLFLVRTLALQLGGRMELGGRAGGGTEAQLTLPV